LSSIHQQNVCELDETGGNQTTPVWPVAIGDRCRYLPRGLRWDWRGVRFGALGGAFSVDRRERVEGESWWWAEVISDADVERLGDARLDVLVTRDAPEGVPLRGLGLPPVDQVLAGEVRARIRSAVESTEPRLTVWLTDARVGHPEATE
jgi:hypothetical protein